MLQSWVCADVAGNPNFRTQWNYQPLVADGSTVEVWNNGHTIQLQWGAAANYQSSVTIRTRGKCCDTTIDILHQMPGCTGVERLLPAAVTLISLMNIFLLHVMHAVIAILHAILHVPFSVLLASTTVVLCTAMLSKTFSFNCTLHNCPLSATNNIAMLHSQVRLWLTS